MNTITVTERQAGEASRVPELHGDQFAEAPANALDTAVGGSRFPLGD
jgi:hypothetical protein